MYIQRTRRIEKLTKTEQESLVFDLVHALVQTQTVGEAALFVQDLLTKSEMKMLGKRLRIAKLLLSGMTYDEIQKNLHSSHTTVAKIAAWLAERGDGFRKIVERLPKEKQEEKWFERSEWDSFKRRYSLYFWPELLLEEIIKNANQRQKERIKSVLERLEEKSELHKNIEKLLHF
jgi:TrpR-related protein YerC/YecD